MASPTMNGAWLVASLVEIPLPSAMTVAKALITPGNAGGVLGAHCSWPPAVKMFIEAPGLHSVKFPSGRLRWGQSGSVSAGGVARATTAGGGATRGMHMG